MQWRKKEHLLFLIYVVFLGVQFFHHELWRDEIHSWYIAKSSTSFFDLWHNVDYEGHPFGWYTFLFLSKQIYSSILTQSFIHYFFVLGLAYLFIYKSPFTFWFKVLLLFGLYFGYEYATLQRNYTPALFFIVWSFVSFLTGKKILPYVLLLLAGFINIHAFILCSVLYVFYLWQRKKTPKEFLPHLALLVLYTILFYIDIKPNAVNVDMHYELHWTQGHFTTMLFAFNDGLFKAPAIAQLFGLVNLWGALVFFVLTLAVPIFFFKKNRKIQLLWLAASIGYFVFWFFFFKPYLRHSGHIWILLLLCSWFVLHQHKNYRGLYFVLVPFAIMHLIYGVKFIKHDLLYPVSQIEAAAHFVKQKKFKDYALVGDIDYCTSPIGCLSNKKMHYPQSPNRNTFIQYTTERLVAFDAKGLSQFSDSVANALNKKVLLIANRELAEISKQELARFTHPRTREEENYYLYKFLPAENDLPIKTEQ
jgi:hypothetical protein